MDPGRHAPTMSPSSSQTSQANSSLESGDFVHDRRTTKESRKDDKRSQGAPRGKRGLFGKMHKITDWLSTSEPSSEALKQHKRESFKKAGIPLKNSDGQASAKLHAPIGEIPASAIRPAGGPSPEELAKKRAVERRRLMSQSCSSSGGGRGIAESVFSQSSSGFSTTSASSQKGSVSCPWEDVPFDGWNRIRN